MSYTPLQLDQKQQTSYSNSMMPRKGLSLEDLAQTMSLDYALKVTNYIPNKYGLDKRRGLLNIFERTGANAITLLKEFTSNVWIFGYSTKVEAYNMTTGVFTTIKSDFSSNSGFGGDRYGEYFFVCNGVEKVWRIDNALAIAEVAASPICSGLKVIGPRIYAYNLSTDATAVQYSEVDDASNPPFDAWSDGVLATQGGKVNYRNAGTVRSVCQLGPYTVVFCDKGFYSFYINTIDAAGTLNKTEVIQNYTQDFGGATGAIETPFGIFYLNEAGLWHMVSVGQTDVPMSRQQVLTSELLGSEYFQDISQTTVDLVYDANQKSVFVTCAKDSAFNNKVIGYKIDLKAFYEISGWNINRFAKIGEDIYGASSVKTTVYKLFSGYDDDGLSIGTEYYQEIPLGTLFHKHALTHMYAGGFLSPSTSLTIAFDIYDRDGNTESNKKSLTWTVDSGAYGLEYDEWGLAKWGESAWGGDFDRAGLVESFGGGSVRINNFQRLRVRITGGDKLRHILNWLTVKTIQKQPIRRRNIQ